MENAVNGALAYRAGTVVRMMDLLTPVILGYSEFDALRDCINANYERWATLACEDFSETSSTDAILHLLPMAESLYSVASSIYTLDVPASVQSRMYQLVEYFKDQLPDGAIVVDPADWL